MRELGEADAAKRFLAALADVVLLLLRERRGDRDVAEHIEVIEQVERLEHEADVLVAQLRALRIACLQRVEAEHLDLARIGHVEAADDVEQGRLARPGLADQGHQLARHDIEVHSTEDLGLCVPTP